ncbi:MAG: (Fe-S)-binding protein [Chloroflexi bacterium]|nr:(Fe-S)-binding protein [Chloroflexota bacterium]
MCLQVCPTYAVFYTEMDSPRGRIALMRALAEDRGLSEENRAVVSLHLGRCLACRACETACPSGVHYGDIIEMARGAIEAQHKRQRRERFVRWLALQQMLPHVRRLKWIARILWLYQASGLQRLVRALNVLPRTLNAMETILPPIVGGYRDYRAPAPAIGEKRGQVAFFIGCIQEAFLGQVNEASIRVLQRNGYEVFFPLSQTCCGAAQLHVGELELARTLARRNIDAFSAEHFDAIISNAGGCGATLKGEYLRLLKDDANYRDRARQFSAQVRDIGEFLLDHLHVTPRGEVPIKVTYSDSCHLRHVQKIVRPPRELLKQIPGVQLIELAHPDMCCGSAGVFNIVQSEIANAVLKTKMTEIAATGANLVVTTNTGCHMQLIAGARQRGMSVSVMHVVQLLDLSYQVMDQSLPKG